MSERPSLIRRLRALLSHPIYPIFTDRPARPEQTNEEPEPPPPRGGAKALTPELFSTFASSATVPGMGSVAEVKLLVTDVGGEPVLWFMDTTEYAYHYDFARDFLKVDLDLRQFNARTYFRDDRSFLAGSLVSYDHVGEDGLLALEFWPSDGVSGRLVAIAWERVRAGLWEGAPLAYHPASATHEARARQDAAVLEAAGVALVDNATLYADVRFAPLNEGVGFGTLRHIDGTSGRPPSVRDIVIYAAIPNDLPHVAGVITEQPQTPLSHVNLKAKQNDTPNAYLHEASAEPTFAELLGRPVRFEVTAEGWSLREATPAEVEAHLDHMRPSEPQRPPSNLGVTDIRALHELRHADLEAYGAKAANLGELSRILPEAAVPRGFAVPFAAYDDFMRANGFYEEAAAMIADPEFMADIAVREDRLKKLRKRIKKADVPEPWLSRLGELHARFAAEQPLRCRSSTNNEDLEGFNGAGLYDSTTHRPDEGHLGESIKKVWASLWTLRAFEERSFYRVIHEATYMGVAVHPNFDDERVNGVAVTHNVLDERFPGFYINAQVGELLVTNPEPGEVPEEWVVGFMTPDTPEVHEVIPIRPSSLSPDQRVLGPEHMTMLVGYLDLVDAHFERVLGKPVAMDVEFKVTKDRLLVLKQARPWVE